MSQTDGSRPKMPTDLFVGGAWVPASSGDRFDVVVPATGTVIATVADGDVVDAIAAVDAAEAAAPGWAATPPRRRGEILRRAFELMTQRAEDLALLISLENGKVLTDARGEVAYAAEFFRWYSEEAVRAPGSVMTAPPGANRILVVQQPVGICVLVTPWNFPAAMATRKIGPALAAGCTVVLKPASDTPLTALAMAKILAEAGVPNGVVNVIPSRHSGTVVSAMLHDPRVRKLSFTGSTEVGRLLLAEAAHQVVNTSMELGGNAPFLVFADADLDAAIEGARAVVGGIRPERDGFYFEPTVLVNVHPDAAILREEIFGPVAPIVAFEDEARAVAFANATEHGLVAYVYTGDLARGLRVSEALEFGMVGLNRGLVSDPAAPFGGSKQSGIGREGGHDGMLDYLESKYIAVQW